MTEQITRLEMTWRALRRNHTDTAVLFEKKLKPFMNLLNDGDGELPGRRAERTCGRRRLGTISPRPEPPRALVSPPPPADSVVSGPVAVPHLVPLLMAMEGDDPVEDSERGCELLYDVLQAARRAALHAPDYQQHARALLAGTRSNVFSLFIYK